MKYLKNDWTEKKIKKSKKAKCKMASIKAKNFSKQVFKKFYVWLKNIKNIIKT